MSLPRPPQQLIGQRFGFLTILSLRHISYGLPGRWGYMALCQCDCGSHPKEISTAALRSKRTGSCGCDKSRYVKTTGSRHVQFKGFGEIRAHFWGGYQRGAHDRKIPFDLTMEYAWGLFEKQECRCALSGVPLVFGAGKNSRTTASLDRIDNTKGYVEGNVQWVHKRINLMRNNLGVAQFVEWCARVVVWSKTEPLDLTQPPSEAPLHKPRKVT